MRRALQEKEVSFKNLGLEYENFRRQVKEFEGQVTNQNNNVSRELEESKRRIYEYENKIQSLIQENERITRSG